MSTISRLSSQRIEEAFNTIDRVFLNSPQYVNEPLSTLFGVNLVLKIETLNPIRSFKGRGADWLISQVGSGTFLICASAGNFGQAMAYSCRKKKINLTVYASTTANKLKIERMRSFGANVILFGADFDAAKIEAKRIATEKGIRYIEDSQDIETVEGAGTIGIELLQCANSFDALLIPLGNGAMINGIACVYKSQSPKTRIIAVQAKGASAMVESWQSGTLINHDIVNTIADGIAVRLPVAQALEDMKGLVDEAILVKEESIVTAMKLIHTHCGIVVEPSGVVGVAAILEHPDRFRGQTVGAVICGGNLTQEQMDNWL
ncbi:MAG: pyridoxal-phosphate dependent enzyme [Bacteroidia bacterium]|nr:pyridoxal-phosphate dependent enzyme [Bacteroidia bacterium]